MQLYAGLDLHSRSTFVGILDQDFNRIYKKRISNDLHRILTELGPLKKQLKGLVVESTYNWYWLVDGLMDAGFENVCLASPSDCCLTAISFLTQGPTFIPLGFYPGKSEPWKMPSHSRSIQGQAMIYYEPFRVSVPFWT